jgi:hypothetical protein
MGSLAEDKLFGYVMHPPKCLTREDLLRYPQMTRESSVER